MRVGRVSSASSGAKSIELGQIRLAGPETAARLGVPVGTKLHPTRDEIVAEFVTVAYWHRNPIRRLLARLTRRSH